MTQLELQREVWKQIAAMLDATASGEAARDINTDRTETVNTIATVRTPSEKAV